MLPDLEGFGLISQTMIGELQLMCMIDFLGMCEDVFLLAVPGIVVAGIVDEDAFGEGVGISIEEG